MSILSKTKILAFSFAALAFSFPLREANASSMKPIEAVAAPGPPRGLEEETLPATPSPTLQPTLFETSIEEAKFRQEFLVDDASAFGDDVVATLELLYATYTTEYAPDSDDARRRISTDCTVERQTVLTVDPDDAIPDDETDDDHLLILDFTVTFSSPYHDVTSYPRLFQDWANSNLDVMLRDVQGLRTDVNTLDKVKRIVVSAMTMDPTSVPANPPAPSPAPTTPSSPPAPSVFGRTAAPTRSPTAAEDLGKPKRPLLHWMKYARFFVLILVLVAIVIAMAVRSKRRSRSEDASKKTSDPKKKNRTDYDDCVDYPRADDLERGHSQLVSSVKEYNAETGGYRADAALNDFSFGGNMQSINLDY